MNWLIQKRWRRKLVPVAISIAICPAQSLQEIISAEFNDTLTGCGCGKEKICY
jgi:hypothetical protein